MDSQQQNNTQTQPAADTTITLVPTNLIDRERHSIYQERRRQACWAFNLSWGLTGISGLLGIAVALLLFSGRVSEGIYTAAGGGMYGTVTVSCRKLAKDANDRLDVALRALEQE